MLRHRVTAGLAVLAATAVAAPAARAHDAGAQAELQAIEALVLGDAHAAEHEELRRAQAVEEAPATAAAPRAAAAAGPRDRDGAWRAPFDIPVFAINAILLPTGKVLWFAYPNNPDRPAGPKDEAHAWLWDPRKGTGAAAFRRVDPPLDPATGKPVNIWCAGNSLLADGRVLVTGGNLAYPATSASGRYEGLNHVYTFDPFRETWTRQPDMEDGRWYPSQLLMPDGRTLIVNGLDANGRKNEAMELFTPSPAMNGVGTIAELGRQPQGGDYYPHLFWMPSGRALVAGPFTTDSWWLDPPGNPPRLTWEDVPNFSRARVWGSAVLVPGGPDGSHEVVQLGGSDLPANLGEAVATAELFDERANRWRLMPTGGPFALNHARSHHNTVLLPDGSMVTVGGGVGTVLRGANGAPGQWAAGDEHRTTELWDPATREWRVGAAQREYRAYHSTAVLLPDATVVSAGDDYNGPSFTEDTAEVYEPPYLFDGDARAPRPAIVRAPGLMTWGRTAEVAVARAPGTARDVVRAALVAPGAATHAVDMNQRYVPLDVVASAPGALTVRAPATPDVALPGWYMLFVLDAAGTPSMAAWVRLATPPPPPPPRRGAAAAPATPDPEPEPRAEDAAAKPAVAARIVRRAGRRRVRVRLAPSAAPAARVAVRLLDRRGRVRHRARMTVPTGRASVPRWLAVPRGVRAVRATVRATRTLPRARAKLVRRGGARRVLVRVARGHGRWADVVVRVRGRRARVVVRTGRRVIVPRLRAPGRARGVRLTVLGVGSA